MFGKKTLIFTIVIIMMICFSIVVLSAPAIIDIKEKVIKKMDIIFQISDVIIEAKPIISINNENKGNINFKCDGKNMVVYLNEPNYEIADDFEKEASKICTKVITNVIDWKGNKLQENKHGLKSFNINVLKEDECIYNHLLYDKKDKDCYIEEDKEKEVALI